MLCPTEVDLISVWVHAFAAALHTCRRHCGFALGLCLGALEGVGSIFGLHVWPFIPSGMLGSRAGPLMGACQQFQITIRGLGGHAAMPHTVVDPIVASSHVIIALQVNTLINEQTSP